jgi:hypothetical protein
LFDHLLNYHIFVVPYFDDVYAGGEVVDVDFGLGFSYGLGDELLSIEVINAQGAVLLRCGGQFNGDLGG